MLVLARIFLLVAGLPALAQTSFPHEECIKRAASQYDLEPALIAAVASVESGLNAQAVSSSDAIGLMQIKWPLTAKHLGILNKQQLFEPCTNIGAGSKYLRELLNRFEYRLEHTVSNLMNVAENTSDSRSRIYDADFSVESANLAKAQVLQQVGAAMLTQANARPQLVLQLLQ